MLKPIPKRQIFEARYEQGYRYLDRCGDVMIILENLLNRQTGFLWFPEEIAPTGARLKCPDLDIIVVFTTYNLSVDQPEIPLKECNFEEIADSILATITGRLDLQKMKRFGARTITILPAKSDSIEEAEKMSVKLAPVDNWLRDAVDSLSPRSFELASVFEVPDRSKGLRVAINPYYKIGAEPRVDPRLMLPPHHLPEGQREALLEQLKRAKIRESSPEAGISIDIDYYWMWPPNSASASEFIKTARIEGEKLTKVLIARYSK